MVLIVIFFSTLVLASVWPKEIVIEETKCDDEMWIPTKEDIVLIIERLDYVDGTHDSIRYIKGGTIDKRRN